MDLIWLFLPGIIGLGAITSYEDYKEGKIRNKWILLSIGYASLIILALIAAHWLSQKYLLELSTNMLFAAFIGFGLWHLKVWTAGDGKLFIAFAALIPLTSYAHSYQRFIPSIILLLNIFLIGLIVISISIISKTRLHQYNAVWKAFRKEFLKPTNLLQSALFIFSMFWIIELVLISAGLHPTEPIKILIALGIGLALPRGKWTNAALLICGLIRGATDSSVYSIQFFKGFLVTILIWQSIRFIITRGLPCLGEDQLRKTVKTKDLKPGMIPAEIKKRNKEISCLDTEAEGLTEKQIRAFRKTGIAHLIIQKTIPFAPLITAGALATIIAQGNILIFLTFA